MPYIYPHPRPALTADAVVFSILQDQLQLLLIRRGSAPFAGRWALPGGFCQEEERADQCALRELCEETGVNDIWMEQLKTFDTPGRDPRGWIVSVAYFALIDGTQVRLEGASDARDARWWPVKELPPLAFDHDEIVCYALQRLRNKLRWSNIGSQLLPPRFTMAALQHVHEAVLDDTLEKPLDKRNFHKRMLESGTIRDTGLTLRNGKRGPQPRLYEFVPQADDDCTRTAAQRAGALNVALAARGNGNHAAAASGAGAPA
ncbi:MAG TPA: NUDIX domain-containing protein [Chloroflexota bacterium]|nr:NUDIX domain-containing protein [Chloroflexota bacterium]